MSIFRELVDMSYRYTQPCRMLFVLVPAKPVIVEATGEALKPTDTTNLEKPKEES